jgi:hypothetical protein
MEAPHDRTHLASAVRRRRSSEAALISGLTATGTTLAAALSAVLAAPRRDPVASSRTRRLAGVWLRCDVEM